jgi:hypothetical protein
LAGRWRKNNSGRAQSCSQLGPKKKDPPSKFQPKKIHQNWFLPYPISVQISNLSKDRRWKKTTYTTSTTLHVSSNVNFNQGICRSRGQQQLTRWLRQEVITTNYGSVIHITYENKAKFTRQTWTKATPAENRRKPNQSPPSSYVSINQIFLT